MKVLADAEKQKARLDICRACPLVEKLGRREFLRCTRCHCALQAKVMLDAAKCPAGKW